MYRNNIIILGHFIAWISFCIWMLNFFSIDDATSHKLKNYKKTLRIVSKWWQIINLSIFQSGLFTPRVMTPVVINVTASLKPWYISVWYPWG